MNILVVEDELHTIIAVLMALRDRKHNILEAPRIDVALDILRNRTQPLDLMILDIMMDPGPLDLMATEFGLRAGKVVLLEARARRGDDFPVMVLTNIDDLTIHSYFEERGCEVWLKEDFPPRDAEPRVKAFVAARRSASGDHTRGI